MRIKRAQKYSEFQIGQSVGLIGSRRNVLHRSPKPSETFIEDSHTVNGQPFSLALQDSFSGARETTDDIYYSKAFRGPQWYYEWLFKPFVSSGDNREIL
jgi:hypothetical protein